MGVNGGTIHHPQVAKTESFAARLNAVQILVLDEVDQLASVAGTRMGTWGLSDYPMKIWMVYNPM